MKLAEGTESTVVSAEVLWRVMDLLASQGVTSDDAITIPMVRSICKAAQVKMDHAVQIFSRITGFKPRRWEPFAKDQMRRMFHVAEPAFRRHAGNRVNHLSFRFTLRKYCEMQGFWEMLDSLALLRGASNIQIHDAITANVFHDNGWSFDVAPENTTDLYFGRSSAADTDIVVTQKSNKPSQKTSVDTFNKRIVAACEKTKVVG